VSVCTETWIAIARFYSNCQSQKPGKKGFPRFQKDNRSVEYKISGWLLHPTKWRITFIDKKGIGEVKLLGKWDIHIYSVKSIKRVRIVKLADGFYVQFCLAIEVKSESRIADGEIGLDVGLEYFYSDSNGDHEPNPRFLKKAEKAIKHAQKLIYKKEKGKSQRRKTRVCEANALVVYEDLNVKNMVNNHGLAKSINDVAWAAFRQWLEYFAVKFGSESCCGSTSLHITKMQ
jgi:putative transposase